MFSRILIANRGEIACRIIRTAHRMGIECVAVFSDADAAALHVAQADTAVHIGGPAAVDSYLNAGNIIDAALRTGAQAIHPGYGFLSENPEFVEAVESAGLVFIGPGAAAIRAMGLKDAAKSLMEKAGVPVVPGYHGDNQAAEFLAAQAQAIGYPVLIKARAGGGGKGMRLVHSAEHFAEALASATREGQSSFGDAAVLVEKYITSPRHIEIQVLADSHGEVVHLFERDCSLQRRHQKVIEEAPAPGMSSGMRAAMTQAAVTAAKAINYCGAGTIEFIADGSSVLRPDAFWFMEMNTRLQVEHPVTEAITGIDLVEMQLRVAAGQALPMAQKDISVSGHAFEARVYAEDVSTGFLPATGQLSKVVFGQRVRVDSGVVSGDTISPYYDPMIAKLISHGASRTEALDALHHALRHTHVAGTVTNSGFLQALCKHSEFRQATMDTSLIERHLDALTTVAPISESTRLVASILALGIDCLDTNNGWRLFSHASRIVKLREAQDLVERRLLMRGDGVVQFTHTHQTEVIASIRILQVHDNVVCFEEAGCICRVDVVRWLEGNAVKVSVLRDGQCSELMMDDPRDAVTDTVADSNALIAPMTGVVRVVNAQAGQAINAGDTLIVMEAMKMETSVTAARSGVVEQLLCKVGDTVDGGSVLVSLEPIPD